MELIVEAQGPVEIYSGSIRGKIGGTLSDPPNGKTGNLGRILWERIKGNSREHTLEIIKLRKKA